MKLLYLSLLSFVLISSSALFLSTKPTSPVVSAEEKEEAITYPPIPVLSSEIKTFPLFSAQAALAVDLTSGVSLYEKDPEKQLLPASTTKIVTALVAMDYYSLNEVIKVGDVSVEGQKMRLVPGEEITVSDLLYGLLVYSANDAAEVLAQNYQGGREAFVEAMNVKAIELNLNHSHFTNPTGLDDSALTSTAKDLTRVATVAMQNPYFSEIVRTKQKIVKSVDGKIVHRLTNVNELLGKVDGVMGVKTGWTENARENLVTYVDRNDHKIMIAILGSQDRFGETKELINWIFGSYEWQEVKYPAS